MDNREDHPLSSALLLCTISTFLLAGCAGQQGGEAFTLEQCSGNKQQARYPSNAFPDMDMIAQKSYFVGVTRDTTPRTPSPATQVPTSSSASKPKSDPTRNEPENGELVIRSRRTEGMATSLGKYGSRCLFLTAAHVVGGDGNITLTPWRASDKSSVERPASILTLDHNRDMAILVADADASCTIPPVFDLGPTITETLYLVGQPDTSVATVSKGSVSAFVAHPSRGNIILSDAISDSGYSGGGAWTNRGLTGYTIERSGQGRVGFSRIMPICNIADRLPIDRPITGSLRAPGNNAGSNTFNAPAANNASSN